MNGDTLEAEYIEGVDYEEQPYDDECHYEGDPTQELEPSVATGDLGRPGRLTGCGCRLAWPTLDALCMFTHASAWFTRHSRAQWCGVVWVWCALMCVSLAVRVCSGAGSGCGCGCFAAQVSQVCDIEFDFPYSSLGAPPFWLHLFF